MISLHSTPSLTADSRSVLETALDRTPAGFAIIDRDSRFQSVNEPMATITGRTVAEHLGRHAGEILGETHWSETIRPVFERALAGSDTRNLALPGVFPFPSGETRHVYASCFGMPAQAGGQPAGVVLLAHDITDCVAAEVARQQEMAHFQQAFMRDVLSSVTGGRLTLCAFPADLPSPLSKQESRIRLTPLGGIRELRKAGGKIAKTLGFPHDRWFDFETSLGEAATNAVAHAGGGDGMVSGDAVTGVLQVRVTDHGKGIALKHLPQALLRQGFTTAGTMGQGFKMILKLADRVWLYTGDDGTVVVLEKERC